MKKRELLHLCIVLTMALSAACAPQPPTSVPTPPISATSQDSSPTSLPSPSETMESATPTIASGATEVIPTVDHRMKPAELVPAPGTMIVDVESSGTGPQGRAPYGDSYRLNRFERPFGPDMTYIPDMDIHRFGLSEDEDWYYISIQLIGNDPNNALGIHYGVEIDLNIDGFGDYLLWAHPPYTTQWETSNVQVFQDSNADSGGLSALHSDAAFDGNGYDTLIFDGSAQQNTDPDVAWVRISPDPTATLQFAFKRSLMGSFFMVGIVSDAGLKDVSKYDYADHFTEADAGSPVQTNPYYPLGLVYGVDNTCWEAYGIPMTGYEPKLCQPILQPTPTSAPEEPILACSPPPNCGGGPYNPVTCECE